LRNREEAGRGGRRERERWMRETRGEGERNRMDEGEGGD